ncbi:UNVERIFIED_CONTAM: Mortality factor 4-like protein 1 [Trichonephila clavipes]
MFPICSTICLVQLPSRTPVDTIIADYIKQRLSVKGVTPNKETVVIETTNGIREYFNTLLGKRLLYNAEKSQYAELLAEDPDMIPSQIYGAIHLLRLFSKYAVFFFSMYVCVLIST